MKLSKEMERCIEMLKHHGKLIRYDGGFWAEENATLSPLYNGGELVSHYPKNHFGTNTIKALLDRRIIKATKEKAGWNGRKYPIECVLINPINPK